MTTPLDITSRQERARDRLVARCGAMPADWFTTQSGRLLSFSAPDPEEICIEDIAYQLARTFRFGGMSSELYSVAQHSVVVSHAVPLEAAMAGLLHDAPEYVLGDVIRPLKRILNEYQVLEATWWQAIREWAEAQGFYLPGQLPAVVKEADYRALLAERQALMPARLLPWVEDELQLDPLPDFFPPLSPERAEEIFLKRFTELLEVIR